MKRDIKQLEENPFDAIVIGGGIHGATIFHQLAVQGMRVALVEKNDFAGGTSSNSLKILHSGLRYLQHLDFGRIRESVRSRKCFVRMAPHLVRPMPCIMPTYGFGLEGRPVMAVALMLFGLISIDRNAGAPLQNKARFGRILSRKKCREIVPEINPQGVTGAVLWYDDLILNTERMVFAYIKSAMHYNAVCANYLQAEKIIITDNLVKGVEVTDRLSGKTLTVKSRLVINAAGPWIGEIQLKSGQATAVEDLVKSVNIVVDRELFPGYGVGLAGREEHSNSERGFLRKGRLFFFVPWRGRTMIGTSNAYVAGNEDDGKVTRDDIEELLNEVNTIYPAAKLSRENVVYSHVGQVPAHRPRSTDREEAEPVVIRHSRIIDHVQSDGVSGLLTIVGVKYTTAPAVADEIVRLLRKRGLLDEGKTFPGNCSGETLSSGSVAPQEAFKDYTRRFPHLEDIYGEDRQGVFRILAEDEANAEYLVKSPPLLKAEVIYAVQEEMAFKLGDVVFRRNGCGTLGCPSRNELRKIADVMADELRWSEATINKEVEEILHYYHLVLGMM